MYGKWGRIHQKGIFKLVPYPWDDLKPYTTKEKI